SCCCRSCSGSTATTESSGAWPADLASENSGSASQRAVAAADPRLYRLYHLLRCPICSSQPRPGSTRCGGCRRLFEHESGLLDLLPEDLRAEADHFAERYRARRVGEGWAAPTGREGPDHADGRWRRRVEAVKSAVAILEHDLPADPRPVVGDVGAGGGWA